MAEFVHVYNDGGGIRNVPMREGATRFTTDRVLFQSGVPFWIPPGDGGPNGLSFTGIKGVFTLSAAAPMQYAVAFTKNCYCYLPAGAGGLAGGWYWCQMSDDTNGEIFSEMHVPGSGPVTFVASPTALPNCTSGRITQSLSEITAISVIVPGSSMGPNGICRYDMSTRYTNSAGLKGLRIRWNGKTRGYLSGTTSNGVIDSTGLFQNLGVVNKQTGVSGSTGRLHSGTTTMSSGDNNSDDSSMDQIFTASLYLGVTTDSVIGVFRKLTVEYGA
jgi:hypothetical protein